MKSSFYSTKHWSNFADIAILRNYNDDIGLLLLNSIPYGPTRGHLFYDFFKKMVIIIVKEKKNFKRQFNLMFNSYLTNSSKL